MEMIMIMIHIGGQAAYGCMDEVGASAAVRGLTVLASAHTAFVGRSASAADEALLWLWTDTVKSLNRYGCGCDTLWSSG